MPPSAAPGPAMVLGRSVVLGAAGFGSGVVSHLAGGGRLPGGTVLVLLLGLSVIAASSFLRTRASAGRLVLLVAGAQTAIHLALSLLAGHAGDARSATYGAPPAAAAAAEGRRTGTLFDAYAATIPQPAAPSPGSGGEGIVAHQLAHLGEQGAAMVLMHVLGALALALFLAWGESALWRVLDLVAAEIGRSLVAGRLVVEAARQQVPRPRRCAPHAAQVFHPLRLARATTRRRGPPALLAA